MADSMHELLVTLHALDKLGARGSLRTRQSSFRETSTSPPETPEVQIIRRHGGF